ncbi:MAG: hypothetical protein ACHQDE_03205 [Acidimicrobiia bacterium]
MARLRTILVLRGLFASFFLGLGVVLLVGGDAVFGCFAIAVGVVNAVLVAVLAPRARADRPAAAGPGGSS